MQRGLSRPGVRYLIYTEDLPEIEVMPDVSAGRTAATLPAADWPVEEVTKQ